MSVRICAIPSFPDPEQEALIHGLPGVAIRNDHGQGIEDAFIVSGEHQGILLAPETLPLDPGLCEIGRFCRYDQYVCSPAVQEPF